MKFSKYIPVVALVIAGLSATSPAQVPMPTTAPAADSATVEQLSGQTAQILERLSAGRDGHKRSFDDNLQKLLGDSALDNAAPASMKQGPATMPSQSSPKPSAPSRQIERSPVGHGIAGNAIPAAPAPIEIAPAPIDIAPPPIDKSPAAVGANSGGHTHVTMMPMQSLRELSGLLLRRRNDFSSIEARVNELLSSGAGRESVAVENDEAKQLQMLKNTLAGNDAIAYRQH